MQEKKTLKNKKICIAISDIIKKLKGKKRTSTVAYECELPRSVVYYLEQGQKDPQLTTFWRLAEGFELKPSELLKMVEDEMPKGWKLLDE